MGWWDTAFGGEAETNAANANRKEISTYDARASDALKTGYATGTENINKAIGAFAPLSTLATDYNRGGTMYMDALGLGTPEQQQAAYGKFHTDPGYGGAVTAGLDAINRRRGAGNMSNSGNADIDALTFGQNLQDQQYQRWLSQLRDTGQTGIGLAGTVAQGQSGGYTNLANLAKGYGEDVSGVAGNVLSGNTSANTLEATGKASGAKNLLNAGMSLASLAMAPMTGGMSLAGMGVKAGGEAAGGLFAPKGGYTGFLTNPTG
jgi:hypothetical protein